MSSRKLQCQTILPATGLTSKWNASGLDCNTQPTLPATAGLSGNCFNWLLNWTILHWNPLKYEGKSPSSTWHNEGKWAFSYEAQLSRNTCTAAHERLWLSGASPTPLYGGRPFQGLHSLCTFQFLHVRSVHYRLLRVQTSTFPQTIGVAKTCLYPVQSRHLSKPPPPPPPPQSSHNISLTDSHPPTPPKQMLVLKGIVVSTARAEWLELTCNLTVLTDYTLRVKKSKWK